MCKVGIYVYLGSKSFEDGEKYHCLLQNVNC